VKNARRHVTIVAKLGNESATCTLPQDLATGGSDEIGKQVSSNSAESHSSAMLRTITSRCLDSLN